MSAMSGEPWAASDGSRWLRDILGWTGWMPGEDGTWFLTDEQFRRLYPESPDGGAGR